MAYLKNLKVNISNIQLKNTHLRCEGNSSLFINSAGTMLAKTDSRFANSTTKAIVSYPLTSTYDTLKDQMNFAVEGGLVNSGNSSCRGILVSGKVRRTITTDSSNNVTSGETFEVVIPIDQLRLGTSLSTNNGIVTNVTIGSILVSTGMYISDTANGPGTEGNGSNCTFNVGSCVANTNAAYIEFNGNVPKLHFTVTFAGAYGYWSDGAGDRDTWLYVTAWLVVKK